MQTRTFFIITLFQKNLTQLGCVLL